MQAMQSQILCHIKLHPINVGNVICIEVCHAQLSFPFADGLDFFFDKKEEARKLVDFLLAVVPCR